MQVMIKHKKGREPTGPLTATFIINLDPETSPSALKLGIPFVTNCWGLSPTGLPHSTNPK